MLSNKTVQWVARFLLITVIFSIIVVVIGYTIHFQYEPSDKLNPGMNGVSAGQNFTTVWIFMSIVCIVYYLLIALIRPLQNGSPIFIGILMLLLTYLGITFALHNVGLGKAHPFQGKYILSFLLRSGIIFFLPFADRFLRKRFIRK